MQNKDFIYPGVTEPPRPTLSSHAEPQAAKPKRKRVKKTLEQQVAETEEHLKKLKAKQRAEARAARTHRLVETGAVVEKALGIEFTEKGDREQLLRVLCKTRRRNDGSAWTWAEAIAQAYSDSVTGGDR